jgi:hypothetical protein
MSYLRCSVRIGLQLFVGGYMPPVVCRRVHVLFTMFGSSLPPVVYMYPPTNNWRQRQSNIIFKRKL